MIMTTKNTQEDLMPVLAELSKYPLRHALPLCLFNPVNKPAEISNGTMTFLESDDYILGITCWHILEEYMDGNIFI